MCTCFCSKSFARDIVPECLAFQKYQSKRSIDSHYRSVSGHGFFGRVFWPRLWRSRRWRWLRLQGSFRCQHGVIDALRRSTSIHGTSAHPNPNRHSKVQLHELVPSSYRRLRLRCPKLIRILSDSVNSSWARNAYNPVESVSKAAAMMSLRARSSAGLHEFWPSFHSKSNVVYRSLNSSNQRKDKKSCSFLMLQCCFWAILSSIHLNLWQE